MIWIVIRNNCNDNDDDDDDETENYTWKNRDRLCFFSLQSISICRYAMLFNGTKGSGRNVLKLSKFVHMTKK